MLHGNRGSRSSDIRRYEIFVPRGERLEGRQLLAITGPFDLVGQAPPGLPQIAINHLIGQTTVNTTPGTPPPYGVLETGLTPGGGAGFSAQPAQRPSTKPTMIPSTP